MKKQLSTKGKIHFTILLCAGIGVIIWLPVILITLHYQSEFYFIAEIMFWISFVLLTFETFRFYR